MSNTIINEIQFLIQTIKRLGTKLDNGQYSVKFGSLIVDDNLVNTLEAPVGTLKAAKKRKLIYFQPELLLSPTHNHIDIILLSDQVQ